MRVPFFSGQSRKRRILTAVVGVAVAVSGGAVFAFFTASGTGTGTGNITSTAPTVVLHQLSITYQSGTTAFSPGTTATVAFTADNSSSAAVTVGTISLSSWTSNVTGCSSTSTPPGGSGTEAAWFSMTPVAENNSVPANTTGWNQPNNGTVTFVNAATSQNICLGATVTFTYTSS